MRDGAVDARIELCGLGGQGIVFLSRVVAEAALIEGREVLAAETHGMSQRGGAVEAHVKVGSFESSLVRRGTADVALALDASRAATARALCAPDGLCVVSSPEPLPGFEVVGAARAAQTLGFARGANLVVLGFAAARAPSRLPAREAIHAALERLSPEAAREPNRQAFERGFELA